MSEQTAEGYDIPAVEAWVRENVSGLTRIRVCRHLDVHPRLASHGVDVGGVGDAREPHHRNP